MNPDHFSIGIACYLNAEYLSYHLEVSGKNLSVTSADASAFAGMDIKTVAEDINALDMLVRKTGLYS